MSETPTVIYNGACPICAPEVRAYRRQAEAADADLRFVDLNEADMAAYGLTRDEAARRLYVAQDGGLVSGVEAFAVVWSRLPRLRWLARAARLPVIRPVAWFVYDKVLAPLLYALHRRRQRRA